MLSFNSKQAIPLLPLHQSPSPVPTPVPTIVPTPIAASSVLLPPSASTPVSDTLAALRRQTVHIQQSLQSLLDAQSEGLLAGLGQSNAAEATPTLLSHGFDSPYSENGSRTPTTRASSVSGTSSTRRIRHAAVVTPVRQPKAARRVSLPAARRGLLRGMRALADLKAQEAALLAAHVGQQSDVLAEVDQMTTKRAGLQRHVQAIEGDGQRGRARLLELEHEEQEMEREVRQLEERLAQLRAAQARLRREREQADNRLEAELSSWKLALAEVEDQMDTLVLNGRPGPDGRRTRSAGIPPVMNGGVSAIEPFRQSVETERKELRRKKRGVEKEMVAADHGAKLWEQVVTTVAEVEHSLRNELGKMDGKSRAADDDEAMRNVLAQMEAAAESIHEQLEVAMSEGWNLLVCCIGAELEALRQGYDILQTALKAAQPELLLQDPPLQRSEESTGSVILSRAAKRGGDTLPQASAAKDIAELGSTTIGMSSEEDEPPGPELLISHQEEHEY